MTKPGPALTAKVSYALNTAKLYVSTASLRSFLEDFSPAWWAVLGRSLMLSVEFLKARRGGQEIRIIPVLILLSTNPACLVAGLGRADMIDTLLLGPFRG